MDVRRTVDRVGIQIALRNAERRVVYGEVMLPAPPLRPGACYRAADLRGRVHYDGGFMTAPEIEALVDRFARKRPSVDVQHDGVPRAATVVESFLAGPGWAPWTEGAWVAGVQLHDEALWARCAPGGDLAAFSIQFLVRVEDLAVDVEGEDGVVERWGLHEFRDADPQYLSLVRDPATGARWKVRRAAAAIHRTLLPVVDVPWDAAAAWDRVGPAGCVVTGDPCVSVADEVGGRLVVVRGALPEARARVLRAGLDPDVVTRALGTIRRYEEAEMAELDRAVVPFQGLPLADPARPWDAAAAEQRVRAWATTGEAVDWARYRTAFVWYDRAAPALLGSYKLQIADLIDGILTAVPRAVFAAAAAMQGARGGVDLPTGDREGVQRHLGRYYAALEREPPWAEERAREAEPADDAPAPAGDEPALPPPADPVEQAPDPVAVDPEPAVDQEFEPAPAAAPDPSTGDDHVVLIAGPEGQLTPVATPPATYQGPVWAWDGAGWAPLPPASAPAAPAAPAPTARATTFAGVVGGNALADALYEGAHALWRLAQERLEDDAEEAVGALQAAVNDFAQWAHAQIAAFGVKAFAPASSPLGLPESAIVMGRAGRKMAKARLGRLKEAVALLADLLTELDEAPEEESRTAVPPAAAAPPAPTDLVRAVEDLTARLDALGGVRPASAAAPADPPAPLTGRAAALAQLRRAMFR